ncbi:MAG: tetratricopeptide repeat protein [Fibromonadaceae bacterium]|nr:tetratricopeptide repeat protein [Fibromonadaceae bacterium]
MAKNSNIFFSRLAPGDRRFIKRVGIFLFILLLLSAGAWLFHAYFVKKGARTKTELVLPSVPEFPDFPEFLDFPDMSDTLEFLAELELEEQSFEEPQELPRHLEGLDSEFDTQAHLQLMRQNAEAYNFRQAHRHGSRILGYLLTDPELSVEWGRILLEAGLPREAVPVLQRLDAKDLLKGKSIIDLGLAMHRSGNSNEAVDFLDNKIRQQNNADFVAIKAAIISEHSDISKRPAADQIFQDVLRRNPSSPIANYFYGRHLMERGDFQKSKTHLERALKAKPNEPRYVARLGMAEFYLKRDSQAEALYKRALKLNPHDPNTWFNLGELYLSQANESGRASEVRKKTRLALESYLETIGIDSTHTNANFRIGLILNGNGEHREAIRHLDIALERMPRNISVMLQLSSAYLHLQDTAKSIEHLEKILHIDPFNRIAATELRRHEKQQ